MKLYWKTTTIVRALRNTGMVAPMVLDGPINGVAFQAYIDQVLVPRAEARRHRDHGQPRQPQRSCARSSPPTSPS